MILIKTLIIVPAYNEENSILNVIENIKTHAKDCDYVVINDCSTDGTEQICRQNGINVISLPLNLGIGGAMQTGYKYALMGGYDRALQIDGDGQHDTAYVSRLLEGLGDADMIIGSRYIQKEGFQSSRARRIGIKYFSFLVRILTGLKITDPTSGFRACNRRTIEYFAKNYPFDYPEPEVIVLLAKKGFKITETDVQMKARTEGKSSITTFRSIYYMFKVSLGMLFACVDTN